KSGDVTFGGDFSVPHTTIDGGTATFKGGADVDKLELKGGVANFSSDGEDATIGELDQSGGTLGGTGKVSITDTYNWSGGGEKDAGTTHIGSQAEVKVTKDVSIGDNRKVENDGQFTIDGGTVTLGDKTSIDDSGTIELKGDDDIAGGATSELTIEQSGTLKKSGGEAASLVDAKIENDGVIEAASGSLQAGEDYSSDKGTVKIADGAEFRLDDGKAAFDDNSTVEGTGDATLAVDGADATFKGTLHVKTLAVADGTASLEDGEISIDTLEVSGGTFKLGTDVTVSSVKQTDGTID